MSGVKRVDRFWSNEASNIRCVRESDYDALAAELDQWKGMVGAVGATIPLAYTLSSLASEQSMVTYFKALHAERDQLQRHVAELEGALHDCRGPVNFDLERKVVEQPQAAREALSVENQRITPVAPLLAPAAAVVMPERMTTIPEGKTISYAAGYEDALDAVASLNRNTVPLELLERIATPCIGSDAERLRESEISELRAILTRGKP